MPAFVAGIVDKTLLQGGEVGVELAANLGRGDDIIAEKGGVGRDGLYRDVAARRMTDITHAALHAPENGALADAVGAAQNIDLGVEMPDNVLTALP